MALDVMIWLICFLLFALIQALIINGVHYCFHGGCVNDLNKGKMCKGNVFYMANPLFFEKAKDRWWSKPLFSCVRCMSSFWGTATFWPVAIWVFGFEVWQIGVWSGDLLVLVYLNYYLYSKI